MSEREDAPADASSESDNALTPSKELGEALQKQFYDPLDHLSPKEQKFALQQVTTTLSAPQIAKRLGLSPYKRRKLEKNEHVQAYIKQNQRRYDDSEMVETARRQRRYIREQMFLELMDRMRDPEAAIEEKFGDRDDISIQEIVNYKERFAQAASFKDFMNIWDKMEKQFRLDSGEATERVDDTAIENQARKRFRRFKASARKKESLKEKARSAVKDGETFDEFKERMKAQEEEEAAADQPEFVQEDEGGEWEQEFEMEEWEITGD